MLSISRSELLISLELTCLLRSVLFKSVSRRNLVHTIFGGGAGSHLPSEHVSRRSRPVIRTSDVCKRGNRKQAVLLQEEDGILA